MKITDKEIRDFYNSRAWKMLRQAKLNLNPLCQTCILDTPSRIVEASHVHHAVSVRRRWVERWDIKLLFSLCDSCHSQVTQEEKQTEQHELDEALRRVGG